jgi:hypothetical protein
VDTYNLNSTKVEMTFRELATLMAAPWDDSEIELFYQEQQLNQSPMLPAEELPLDDNDGL